MFGSLRFIPKLLDHELTRDPQQLWMLRHVVQLQLDLVPHDSDHNETK